MIVCRVKGSGFNSSYFKMFFFLVAGKYWEPKLFTIQCQRGQIEFFYLCWATRGDIRLKKPWTKNKINIIGVNSSKTFFCQTNQSEAKLKNVSWRKWWWWQSPAFLRLRLWLWLSLMCGRDYFILFSVARCCKRWPWVLGHYPSAADVDIVTTSSTLII